MKFMEDTYATASSVREGGTAAYRGDPDDGRLEL